MVNVSGLLVSNFETDFDYARKFPVRRDLASAGEFSSVLALGDPILGGSLTAGGDGPTLTPENVAGRLSTDMSGGHDWFEKVHIIPRTKVDFGNIVGTVERRFEIFNAYRRTDVTLTAVDNNALPGLELPYSVPPLVVPALTSMLDPASTTNLTAVASGLGVLVQNLARALPQGLPSFDTNIDFTFSPGGTLTLLVKGSRIALLVPEPDAPTRETLEFLTDVIEHLDGSEQRLSVRKQPRQALEYSFALDGTDRQRMEHMLMGWQGSIFAVPVWHEAIRLSANASAAATSVSTASTAAVDFRVDGMAVIYESSTKYDVVQLSAVGASSLTFTDTPLVNSYTASNPLVRVIPVRLAELEGVPSGRRPPYALGRYELVFRVTDNDTGAPTASTSGWSTYLGKVLLDDNNILEGESPYSHPQRITVIDNATGLTHRGTRWDVARRGSQKGFGAHTHAEVLKLKRLLKAVRGRQVSFWMPTAHDDLTVVANLTSGSTAMDIEHVGYTRFVVSQEPRKTLKITFTDGTSLVREVQSSVEVSTSVERLTLNTTWPSTKTPAQVSRVEFYEKVRFDTDRFSIDFDRPGACKLFAPVRVVLE